MPATTIQPITVWGHWAGPNPWKVIIILKELDIPYTHRLVEIADVKKPPLTDINPNGRVPAIEDPNTGVKLWESGAIINYLVTTYDKTFKLVYEDPLQKFELDQWLFFQTSGQGPYFGQFNWFLRYHPEKIPSVIERYAKETERVISVLDGVLAKKSSGWLVGDKCTYADLSFVTWAYVIDGTLKQHGIADHLEQYPSYNKWLKTMGERPSVKESLETISKGRADHGMPP